MAYSSFSTSSYVVLFFLLFISSTMMIKANAAGRPHKTCPIQSIYQFGDSISDVGNLIRLGPSYAGRYPYGRTSFHYPTGRCSNGLLMIDFIAMRLGLPLLNPYLNPTADKRHGVNFAVAGSTALDKQVLINNKFHSPLTNTPLSRQLEWFRNHLNYTCVTHKECARRLERALVFVGEIGGNDYNYGFFYGRTINELYAIVPHVVTEIANAVREVIKAGATRIVVPGNFPVGCIPTYLTTFRSHDPAAYNTMGCLGDLNGFAKHHNRHLKKALEKVRREHPHVLIHYADYYKAFQTLLHRAPSLGFDSGSLLKSCCGTGGEYNFDGTNMCGTLGVPVCTNPEKHISWDGIHPTQEAYRHMAKYLLDDLLPKMKCVW